MAVLIAGVECLTVRAAAVRLQVTDAQVRRLMREGKVSSQSLGGRRFPVARSVDHWKNSRGWCNALGVRGGKAAVEARQLALPEVQDERD